MNEKQTSILSLRGKFGPHFIATVVAVWALDVISKIWAVKNLQEGVPETIIDGFLFFTLRYNTGGILGIFPDFPYLFHIMTGIAIILLAVFYMKTPTDNMLFHMTVALIFGGALGNFTDRFFRVGVVDFIDMRLVSFHWPTYNVADMFITFGAVLLIYVFYQMEKEEKAKEEASNNSHAQTKQG